MDLTSIPSFLSSPVFLRSSSDSNAPVPLVLCLFKKSTINEYFFFFFFFFYFHIFFKLKKAIQLFFLLVLLLLRGQVQIFPFNPLVQVQNIQRRSLEMRSSIIRLRDEHLVALSVSQRLKSILNDEELLLNRTQGFESGLQLGLGVLGLDGGGADSNVVVLSGDVVRGGDNRNVNVRLPSNLLLGENDLAGVDVFGVGDGVLHDTDTTDDLASLLDLVGEIRGITSDELGLGDLTLGLNTSELTILIDDLLDGLVQHVGSTIDGGKTSEGLGELGQTVERVDVRGFSVAHERLSVQLDTTDGGEGQLVEVGIITVESDGVTDEVNCVLFQLPVGEHLPHCDGLHIELLVRLGVVLVKVGDKDNEVLASTLLKEAHQVGGEGLLVGGGDLLDLLALQHIGTLNALELQVPGDSSVEENLDQETRGHDELGDQIDVPVTRGTEGSRGRSAAVLLVKLLQVQRGRLTTIVGVSVHVQHLQTGNRQQTGKDALGQTSTEHNGIILIIHFF